MPDSLQCDKCHYINESKTKSTGSLIANQILYQSNDLHAISCSPPLMHICTYAHAWYVDVGERAGEFSFYFQGVATSFKTLFLLHLSASLLFSYLVPAFYYSFTKGEKKREAEILSPYCHLPEILQRCCGYRNQWDKYISLSSFVSFLRGFLCPLPDPLPQFQKENMRSGIFSL